MVSIHPSRSGIPKPPGRNKAHWALIGSLGALGILAVSVGYWMHRNAQTDYTLATDVTATLQHDQKIGVPSSQISPLNQQLLRIQHASFGFVPTRFFGTVADIPQKLQALQAQASRLPVHDVQYERQMAIRSGTRLVAAQGSFATLSASQISRKVNGLTHLSQLQAQIHTWESQYTSWQRTIQRLASMGGGLSHDQPNHVLQTERSLKTRLASRGAYWQGVENAESALTQSQSYLHGTPSQELAHYSQMMAVLNQAYNGLQPPTQSQLLQVLAKMSNGLNNNQPADVVTALSALKSKLSQANTQWSGYSQAQSAVNNAASYLGSSVLNQINQHEQLMQELNAALEALKPPAPVIPTTSGNPFGQAFQQYMATRQTVLSAAVYNANTGAVYTYNPGLSFDTASIVKATIMSTLLWKAQTTGQPLTAQEQSLMIPMIEDSSNSAATALWNLAGRSQGIDSFLQVAGMSQTIPGRNGFWGLTQTTALNQVTLLKLLSYPNSVLTPASQNYALNLMEHVIGWEAWGVSSGVTPGSSVALKNGWLPIGSAGWEINSIGHVTGNGRNYVVALLSRNNPSEAYGIQTLDTVSQFIWNSQ